MTRRAAALLVVLLAASPVCGQEVAPRVALAGRDAAGEPLVRLECDGATLGQVVLALARVVRRSLVVDRYTADEPVALSLAATPWRVALERVAAAAGGARVVPLGERALRVESDPRVSLVFEDPTQVRTVLQLTAAYGGLNVLLGEGVRGAVVVSAREVDPLDLLQALARLQGTTVSRVGAVLVLGATPGPAGVDALPPPRPAGRPVLVPGPAVRAVRAPAGPLLAALAASAGQSLVASADAAGDDAERVTLEWPAGVSSFEALEDLAARRGWRLEQVGAVWLVRAEGAVVPAGGPGAERLDPDADRRGTVPVPGQPPLRPALQAVVLADPPLALIDGRCLRLNDLLVRPETDEEVEGVRLVEVGPRHAVIAVAGTDTRERLSLD